MTVVTPLPLSPESEVNRNIILKIFSSIGRCRFTEEKHFDACTALSGSGPAFACVFLEAMADGGVMMGLPRAEALELAAQSEPTIVNTMYRILTLRRSLTRSCPNDPAARSASGSNQGHSHKYVANPLSDLSVSHGLLQPLEDAQ